MGEKYIKYLVYPSFGKIEKKVYKFIKRNHVVTFYTFCIIKNRENRFLYETLKDFVKFETKNLKEKRKEKYVGVDPVMFSFSKEMTEYKLSLFLEKLQDDFAEEKTLRKIGIKIDRGRVSFKRPCFFRFSVFALYRVIYLDEGGW